MSDLATAAAMPAGNFPMERSEPEEAFLAAVQGRDVVLISERWLRIALSSLDLSLSLEATWAIAIAADRGSLIAFPKVSRALQSEPFEARRVVRVSADADLYIPPAWKRALFPSNTGAACRRAPSRMATSSPPPKASHSDGDWGGGLSY
jgi:hypothetical protein